MDWLGKAALTAAAVALLLAVAQRCGERTAGLVAGLPIITAPALLWLAHAYGPAFAAEAGAGCMSAGGLCALFVLGYGLASRHAGPSAALAAGGVSALLTVPLLAAWQPNDGLLMALLALALALACCAACSALLRALPQPRGAPPAAARRPAVGAATQVALTAGASGAVSAAVGVLAADLGAYWAGVVASAPLVAAVVSMWLHHRLGSGALPLFLHGYLAGLIGRTCFAALFALLALPLGGVPAALLAGGALCLCAWLHGRLAPAQKVGTCRRRDSTSNTYLNLKEMTMNIPPSIPERSVRKSLLRWASVALLAAAGSLAVALLAERAVQTPSPKTTHRVASTLAAPEAEPAPAGAAAEPAATRPYDPAAEEQATTF